MTEIPIIETKRLRLRAHRVDDYEADCAMWADPAVVRFIGGVPSTRQQTWSRLLTYKGHWQAMNYGYWAIEEKSTGAFAGEIGFADFKRDIIPAMQNVPELGFALVSDLQGKGYGTEAVNAVLAWGDAHLPSKRTVCMVNENNIPSLRIVEKSGYRIFERSNVNGRTVLFLERAL
ncbi:MAG TPA: GNAT family N-acetyltransferase [Candidatus Baltobacteraceae bacterium]|nr:GNAT family N-acetyltransferase [Candidatus Baltobacteraceae bacterium]